MNLGGWVFLILSTTLVWGMTLWCYWKVLTIKDDHVVKPPDSLGG